MFLKKQYCQGPEDVSQWVGYLPACNKALCLIPSTIYIRPVYLQPITQKAIELLSEFEALSHGTLSQKLVF